MSYQFIHVEAYARQAGKDKEGGRNIRDVIAEAGREPGNCPHVANPEKPNILLGSLQELEQEANEWAEQAKDSRGHAYRKDGLVLLAGVISFPVELKAEGWQNFKDDSVNYLKKKYGENLKCIVEHLDEDHPHLHFYCLGKKNQRFDEIHDGKKAAAISKAEGGKKGEQNLAYIEAMRQFQDDFANRVAQFHGLTRIGPGRRRLTRAQHNAEKQQAKALENVLKKSKQYVNHYKNKGLEIGKKEGFDIGKKEGFQSGFEEAKAKAKELGGKVGGWFDGLKTSWHSPSMQVQTEAQKQVLKSQKALQKAEEQARSARANADNRVIAVAQQLQVEQTRTRQLEKGLLEKEQQIKELTFTAHRQDQKKKMLIK